MKRVLIVVGTLVLLGYAVIVGLNRPSKPAPKPRPFAFTNASIELPADASTLPAGPNVDTVTTACTACHSPSMIATQPALKPEQWAATVKKMREVYKAPIADADVPAILAYLDDMSAKQAAAGQ